MQAESPKEKPAASSPAFRLIIDLLSPKQRRQEWIFAIQLSLKGFSLRPKSEEPRQRFPGVPTIRKRLSCQVKEKVCFFCGPVPRVPHSDPSGMDPAFDLF